MGTKGRGRRSAAAEEERVQARSSEIGFELAGQCCMPADVFIKSQTVSVRNVANTIVRTACYTAERGKEAGAGTTT